MNIAIKKISIILFGLLLITGCGKKAGDVATVGANENVQTVIKIAEEQVRLAAEGERMKRTKVYGKYYGDVYEPNSSQEKFINQLIHYTISSKGKQTTPREEEQQQEVLAAIFKDSENAFNGRVDGWLCTYNDTKLGQPIPEWMFTHDETSKPDEPNNILRLHCQTNNVVKVTDYVPHYFNGDITISVNRDDAAKLPVIYPKDKLQFSGEITRFFQKNSSESYLLLVKNATVSIVNPH